MQLTLSEKLYTVLIKGDSWKTILGGLGVTIQISALALLLGTVLGALVCFLRTRRNPIIRTIASMYIAILRGTPVLMLLLLLYYGVFARTPIAPVMVAVITFALNVSAHVAELLRCLMPAITDRPRLRGRWAFPPGIPSGLSHSPRCCASPNRSTSPPLST